MFVGDRRDDRQHVVQVPQVDFPEARLPAVGFEFLDQRLPVGRQARAVGGQQVDDIGVVFPDRFDDPVVLVAQRCDVDLVYRLHEGYAPLRPAAG